jgi:hypothetical protein
LQSSSLKWASPRTFNDPFDVQTPLVVDVDDSRVVRLAIDYILDGMESNRTPANPIAVLNHILWSHGIKETREKLESDFGPALYESLAKLRALIEPWSKEMLAGLANSKLLCLSERCDITTMWSHYATNHAGAVLEFFGHPHTDSAFKLAKKVNYLDCPPNFVDEEYLAQVLAGYENFDVRRTLDLFIYSKSKEWASEQEWRIDSSDGRQPGSDFEIAPFFPADLQSVTFGLMSNLENRATWIEAAKRIGSHVKFFKVEREPLSLRIRRIAL